MTWYVLSRVTVMEVERLLKDSCFRNRELKPGKCPVRSDWLKHLSFFCGHALVPFCFCLVFPGAVWHIKDWILWDKCINIIGTTVLIINVFKGGLFITPCRVRFGLRERKNMCVELRLNVHMSVNVFYVYVIMCVSSCGWMAGKLNEPCISNFYIQ